MIAGLLAVSLVAPSGVADLTAPELSSRGGYEFRLKPLPQVLAQLRKETGIEISLDPRLADRRLTAFVTDQSRREVMRRMAEVLGAQWSGLRLTPREDLAKFEKEVVEKNLAASKKLMLADLLALLKEADRPYADIRDEIRRTEQMMGDLRRDRPTGWGDRFTAASRRLDKLAAFEKSPGLHSFLREARGWPNSTWQQVVSGRRVGAWLTQEGPAGGQWYWIVGDPFFGNLRTSDCKTESDTVDSFDWPKEDTPRVLPAGVGKGIQRDFKGLEVNWREIPFYPGDVDALELVHREWGVDTISEGLLSRNLYQRLASQPMREAMKSLANLSKTQEIRLDGDWVTYASPNPTVLRMVQGDTERLSAVESGGANDLRSLVQFVTGLNGTTRSNLQFMRARADLNQLVEDVDLFDFLAMLTSSQLDSVNRGQAVPYPSLSPMARNLFRQFAVRGLRDSKSLPEFVENPSAWNSMYFYLERYMHSAFTREIATGKTLKGGINDGVALEGTSPQPTYVVELNFYFGVDFASASKVSTKMGTLVPPPYQDDPKAKPPEHHEGHGPGL